MLQNKYNLTMWQGATFALTITVQNANGTIKDLTNYTARMQIRPSYDSTIVTETLTTANGEITINDVAGSVRLELAAARTAGIPVDLNNLATVKLNSGATAKIPKAQYVYDLELIIDDTVSKLLYGDVTVYGEVTR